MNTEQQKLWTKAAKLNLQTENLKKVYGIRFVNKLIKYVLTKPHPKPYKGLEMIFPKKYRGRELDYDNYIEMLQDAGFKLRQWFEDFTDEDTGEIVLVERHNFQKMKPVK